MGCTGRVIGNMTISSDVTPSLKTLQYFSISQGLTNCYILHQVPVGKYYVRVFFRLIKLGEETISEISVERTRVSSLVQGRSKHDEQVFVEALVYLLNGTTTICFHNVGYGDPAIIYVELLQISDVAYNADQTLDNDMVHKIATRLNFDAWKLKFDEDYSEDNWGEINDNNTREKERMVDLLVNGDTIFRGIYIIKMFGESYASLVLGSSLVIVSHPKLGGHALISAIEIFEVTEKESTNIEG